MPQTIYSHCFENGLVLVAEPISSLESVAFTFMVPSGCRHDPADRAGLAAFTCDMVLRGAGVRDNRQFLQELEQLGVERSESVSNAHASFSGATLAENLNDALGLYADLLQRPRLPADELEAARLVVLQELHAIDDEPGHKLMLELRERHYPDPFGRSSHGVESDLLAIQYDDVQRFQADHYRAGSTIVGVAGRFEWEALKERVGELFGDWPAGNEPHVAVGKSHPHVEHLDHDSHQTQIGIAYPSVPFRDPDYFQAWGAVGVLSGGMSSRLFTEVREKRGLCYSVSASLHTLRDRGCVLCYAGTGAERAQETLDVTLAELVRLGDGVLDDELQRLKARIKSGIIMQQESSAARSGAVARDWYHLGRGRTLDEVGRLVDELTRESINAYLAAHPAKDFTIITLGPSPLQLPAEIPIAP